MLDLVHPVYQRTASYGHFGRKPEQVSYTDGAGKQQSATAFSWEQTDRADELRKAARLKSQPHRTRGTRRLPARALPHRGALQARPETHSGRASRRENVFQYG